MKVKQTMICVCLVTLFLLAGCSSIPDNEQTFTGTIMMGAQLGEVKNYCAEGLYLVANEGYLVNQTQMLLLRERDNAGGSKMLSNQQYVGKKVEVSGKYPAQEVFCEALTCTCEDYILVNQIQTVK